MLLSLQIKNFILIEAISLDFQKGFYVITGETGAGKSVLLDALLFVLGGKFELNPVKAGADMASVTAEFALSSSISQLFEEHGIAPDETLIIKRQQYPDGKKKFFINGETVPAKLLTIVAGSLLEMHGQHSHSILLDSGQHIKILDNFGDLEDAVSALSAKFSSWKNIEREILEIQQNHDRVMREIDFLSFTVKELSDKVPKEGEETELANLRIELQNSSKNQELLQNVSDMLLKSDILAQIGSLQRLIERQSKSDIFAKVLENLTEAYAYMSEAESAVNKLQQNEEIIDLDAVETRLFEIRALARKYNVTSDELPSYYEKSKLELEKLTSNIENLEGLKKQIHSLEKEYLEAASRLSEERKKAAHKLEERIKQELEPLKMGGCKWIVEFTPKEEKEFSSNGIDHARFIASTNPGMPSGPIDKIASGGELARLMLAVKVALFDKFSKPTIIFDEIDTGIGGSVADAIGERLKTLSKIAQVIVITHQPQVVAKADFHILVEKSSSENNTSSTARILGSDGRKAEIARMLSGRTITSGAIAAAEELLG